MSLLAAGILSIAALFDVREYRVPLWVWIPVLPVCIVSVLAVSVIEMVGIVIALSIIWIAGLLYNAYGGGDAIAYSVVACVSPGIVAGMVPGVFLVMVLSLCMGYLFFSTKKHPLVLSIALSYWFLISL